MTKLASTTAALEDALAELKSIYASKNNRSRALFEAAREAMPGGNTRSNLYYDPFPLCMAGGEGAYLTDLDGHRYVDFLCDYTVGAFGHSHPRILRAIREVSEGGLNLGAQNQWEGLFARALCDRFPALELVRFANSGTEANIFALGAARAFTGRKKVVVFDGAYHGGAMTFTTVGAPLNVPFDFLVASYNDAGSVARLLAAEAGEVAAVLVEPMLSSGGCIPGDPAFLRALRQMTADAGVLLIFDEVVTSRLGPGGMHSDLGITPDLITLGKYIGGGLSCGAFGGRADILSQFDPAGPRAIAHSGTFNNNTLSMGVGLVAVTEVFPPREAARLNAAGDELRGRLNALFAAGDAPMTFTGYGSSMNLHFTGASVVRPTETTRGCKLEKALFFFHMLSKGVFLAPRGMINISMAHAEDDIEQLYLAVQDFLSQYQGLLAAERAGASVK